MSKQDIKLGDQIEDIVSKVQGIASGRVEYLDGSKYWIITPRALESAEVAKEVHSPDAYCRRIGDGVYVKPKPQAGFHAREV